MHVDTDALRLHLGPAPVRGRTEWLRTGLRTAVHDGTLAVGTGLPGARPLAAALGLARGTVADAVQGLVDEGYLTARPRSGVVVSWRPDGTGGPPGPPVPRPA